MDKTDLHKLVDELPEGTEQPALWLLRQLQGTGGFVTSQDLAKAIIREPSNRFLLALASASDHPLLKALADDPNDPVARACATAPEDDESLTDEDREALQVAREQVARGEFIPDAELPKRLAP